MIVSVKLNKKKIINGYGNCFRDKDYSYLASLLLLPNLDEYLSKID